MGKKCNATIFIDESYDFLSKVYEYKNITGISIARIQQPKNDWQKYLEGKELIVGHANTAGGDLLGFEGDVEELCKIAWQSEKEHDYDSLEIFIEEVKSGRDGFGFPESAIIILEEINLLDIEDER